MVRSILSVVVGLVVFSLTAFGFEWLSGLVHPLPQGFDANSKEALIAHMSSAPLLAMVLVLVGYAVGSYLGGLVAQLISRSPSPWAVVILGLICSMGGVANFVSLPHPLWFVIVAMLSYLPFALLGRRTVVPKSILKSGLGI